MNNKKYLTYSLYAALAIIIGGAGLVFILNIPAIYDGTMFVLSVLAPIFAGIAVAYIMNPLAGFFETRVFRGWLAKAATRKKKRTVRTVSVLCAALLFLLILFAIFSAVLPQLYDSVRKIFLRMYEIPKLVEDLKYLVGENFGFKSDIYLFVSQPLSEFGSYLDRMWSDISPKIIPLLAQIGGGATNVAAGVINAVLGFVIGANLLINKDMLLMQCRKMIFVLFSKDSCQAILAVSGRGNRIFRKYMSGIILDSFLVGLISFFACLIIGVNFPLVIAVIVFFTNFIPVFGPISGAALSCVLIVIDSPGQALIFLIFTLVLQQFDGNIMMPFIQGDATGVPAIWVIFAVLLGGGFFGFVGILLSIPVFAIIYMLIKEWAEYRLRKKAMPESSLAYAEKSDLDKYHDEHNSRGAKETLATALAEIDDDEKSDAILDRVIHGIKAKIDKIRGGGSPQKKSKAKRNKKV